MALKPLVFYLESMYNHETLLNVYITDMLALNTYYASIHKLKKPKMPIRYWDLINKKSKTYNKKRDYTPQDIINMFKAGGKRKAKKRDPQKGIEGLNGRII